MKFINQFKNSELKSNEHKKWYLLYVTAFVPRPVFFFFVFTRSRLQGSECETPFCINLLCVEIVKDENELTLTLDVKLLFASVMSKL